MILVRMSITSPPRAWAEVDLNAIKHNLGLLRLAAPDTQMMPVIKAGAYGHGLEQVARALDSEGIAFFGVANVGEARRVHQCGCRTKPYILGSCFNEEREEVVANSWRAFISSLEEAEHYNSLARLLGKTLNIHISIDVGMGRGGFLIDELSGLLDQFNNWSNLSIEGVATHLPSADEDQAATFRGIYEFQRAVETVEARTPVKYKHIAASAGILDYSIPYANLARPGLALYGYSPVIDNPMTGELKCALTMKSRVTVVRDVPAGHGISYGNTYITDKPAKIATVGVGYADGYMRALSGQGTHIYYHGQYVPLLGRVTMDQIVLDVSAVEDAREGDTVEIFGTHVTIYELAARAKTIPWEILTAIGPRVPRVYV